MSLKPSGSRPGGSIAGSVGVRAGLPPSGTITSPSTLQAIRDAFDIRGDIPLSISGEIIPVVVVRDLQSNGPGPTPETGKVQLVDASGNPIGQSYDDPLRVSQDRGGTAAVPLYTRSLIVNEQDEAVQVDLVTSNYGSNNRFAVDASIAGGQGETAENPFYVHVVNSTPGGGGLEPKSGGYFKSVDCNQRVVQETAGKKCIVSTASPLTITEAELGGADAKFFRLRGVSLFNIVDTRGGLAAVLNNGLTNLLIALSSGGISIGSMTIGGGTAGSTRGQALGTGNVGEVTMLDASTVSSVNPSCFRNLIGPWIAVQSSVPLALLGVSGYGGFGTPGGVGTCKVGLHFDVLQTASTAETPEF